MILTSIDYRLLPPTREELFYARMKKPKVSL